LQIFLNSFSPKYLWQLKFVTVGITKDFNSLTSKTDTGKEATK
jgi:hypothetical protein